MTLSKIVGSPWKEGDIRLEVDKSFFVNYEKYGTLSIYFVKFSFSLRHTWAVMTKFYGEVNLFLIQHFLVLLVWFMLAASNAELRFLKQWKERERERESVYMYTWERVSRTEREVFCISTSKRTGALHTVRWLKSFFSALKQVFPSFSVTNGKKEKNTS